MQSKSLIALEKLLQYRQPDIIINKFKGLDKNKFIRALLDKERW